jgi:hypothetical protein
LGFLANYGTRPDVLTRNDKNVLLTGGPPGLIRGMDDDLPETHIRSKLAFIGEACGRGKYPFSEVVKCFRWLTPNHEVPPSILEKVRHTLTTNGCEIACD